MKYLIGALYLGFFCFHVSAQTYGNEWIEYNQRYYSFSVVESGIHRIDYNAIVSSGIPLSAINSNQFQVFGREREVPIYISDGGDDVLNNGDFILFYAERNDCWLDSTLYDDPSGIGNPEYSLYNDTIEYFLTWNEGTSNYRFLEETDVDFNNYTPEPFLVDEASLHYYEQYNEGIKSSNASSSFYMSGEGWGKARKNLGHTWNFTGLNLENIYLGSESPNIIYESVLVGSSNAAIPSGSGGNHHTRQTIGSSDFILVDSVFSGYKGIFSTVSYPSNIMNANGVTNFKVSIVNDLGVSTDYQSINYISFKYPRIPLYDGSLNMTFECPFNEEDVKSRIDLTGANLDQPVVFSFGSIPRKIPILPFQGGYSFLLPNSSNIENIRVAVESESQFREVSNLSPVNNDGFFTDFTNNNLDDALLFVYNSLLKSVVDSYASHRSSSIGGGYNVVLAEVKELYQQYGGGIPKHINGIRRFAHQMYDASENKPVGLFLIGKGIREANVTSSTSIGPGTRNNITSYQNSLVPSFGQPSCDACITSNLKDTN